SAPSLHDDARGRKAAFRRRDLLHVGLFPRRAGDAHGIPVLDPESEQWDLETGGSEVSSCGRRPPSAVHWHTLLLVQSLNARYCDKDCQLATNLHRLKIRRDNAPTSETLSERSRTASYPCYSPSALACHMRTR